jgi:hypothetical protein
MVERGAAPLIEQVDIGTGLDEQTKRIDVVKLGTIVNACFQILIGCVHIDSTAMNERVENVGVI